MTNLTKLHCQLLNTMHKIWVPMLWTEIIKIIFTKTIWQRQSKGQKIYFSEVKGVKSLKDISH